MTALPSLYELGTDLEALIERILEAGGVIDEATEAELAQLRGDFRSKAERVGLYHLNLKAQVGAVDVEIKRLQALKAVRENAADSLKAYLLREMQRVGERKLETDRIVITVVTNSRPRIEWTGDPAKPPKAFKRTIVTFDGQKAYEAWRAKRKLPAGVRVEQGVHLRVR